MSAKKKCGLYIHIPFCVKKCAYCDFKSFSGADHVHSGYIDALINELSEKSAEYSDYEIQTIFIGGGTPSLLPSRLTGRLLDAVFGRFSVMPSAEITTEANPKTLDRPKLIDYHYMGINRLSIGLQAWQNHLLAVLGRVHTREDFVKNYYEAREAGFKNISVDLMFSLPSQTREDWRETLESVIRLSPEHISAYSLIIEDGTEFKRLYDQGRLALPSEEEDRLMYEYTNNVLSASGYNRYEISNYSRPGYESRHNSIYWRTGEYIGAGLAAHSYMRGARFYNSDSIRDYIAGNGAVEAGREVLSPDDMLEEFMFMGLRMTEGVSRSEFRRRFNNELEAVFGSRIDELISTGMLNSSGDRLSLTDKGIDVSNTVFERFIF